MLRIVSDSADLQVWKMGRVWHGRLATIEMKRHQLLADVPNRYKTDRGIDKTFKGVCDTKPVRDNNYDSLGV